MIFSHFMRIDRIRYAFLEYLAYWEGQLTASRLGKALGRSREHVQREVITPYRQQFFDIPAPRPEGERPSDTHHHLRFAPRGSRSLIDWVSGEKSLAEALGEAPRFGIPMEDVSAVAFRDTHPEIFQSLYLGCVQRRQVSVEYVSKQRFSVIDFSAHTLVRDFARVHFRGYARWRDEDGPGCYIDLVPSRITQVFAVLADDRDDDRPKYVSEDSDVEWNERVTLQFRLNPDLPGKILDVLRTEYEGSRAHDAFETLTIPDVRRALRRYVERSLRYRFFGDTIYEVWIPPLERKPCPLD